MNNLTLLETTLREGVLMEDINVTVPDKLRIAKLIDSLGVTYLEGGWPQVFEKDLEFFQEVRNLDLKAKLTVFGATRRPGTQAARDRNLKAMLETHAPVCHIYGKVWTLHVIKVLQTTLEENLNMLRDSLELLKSEGKEVIYTAEHFFDGFRTNREYALENVKVALEGGADIITLGDSNGASLPNLVREGVLAVKELVGEHPIGLHLHDDLGLAMANTLAGLEAGASHVQATVNGYGARTGITDLTALLPILKLKMGLEVVTDEQLARLTEVATKIAEIVGLGGEMDYRPVVGRKVFAHKTQTHVSAVLSDPEAYEPIDPAKVGNQRRLVIPGLMSARTTYFREVARKYGVDLNEDSAANSKILEVLRGLEDQGYSFEDAEASLELRLGQLTGRFERVLDTERLRLFEVIRGRSQGVVEASLKVRVGGGDTEYVAAEGTGPVDTLYQVILEALKVQPDAGYFDYMKNAKINAFRVRTLNRLSGETEITSRMRVRVALGFSDGLREWTTIGIDEDIIKASWTALVDGVEYGLLTREGQESGIGIGESKIG